MNKPIKPSSQLQAQHLLQAQLPIKHSFKHNCQSSTTSSTTSTDQSRTTVQNSSTTAPRPTRPHTVIQAVRIKRRLSKIPSIALMSCSLEVSSRHHATMTTNCSLQASSRHQATLTTLAAQRQLWPSIKGSINKVCSLHSGVRRSCPSMPRTTASFMHLAIDRK